MANYRDYVSFELPQWAVNQGMASDGYELTERDRNLVSQAFEEISATPEGQEWIRQAAARAPDGKINVFYNDRPNSTIAGNDIRIEAFGTTTRHFVLAEGEYESPSIQDVIVHELQHMVHDHDLYVRGDEDEHGFSPANEADAIRTTNEFMRKYYKDPPVFDTDHGNIVIDDDYTDWQLQEGFDLEKLRKTLQSCKLEDAKKIGPEMQSLYEFKDQPEKFKQQCVELRESGSMGYLCSDVALVEKFAAKSDEAPAQPEEDNLSMEGGASPSPCVSNI